jgi:ankyrin repeat protein
MASFGLAKSDSTTNSTVVHDEKDPVDTATIFSAASEGNLALLQSSMTLLDFPITTADENGYTLLHAASSYNQLGILQFILNNLDTNNINCTTYINAGDSDGDTALHYAGSADAAIFLVEHYRINTTKVNSQGKTALQTKEAELDEMKNEEDIEEDDEEIEVTKKLISYLQQINVRQISM